MKRFLIANPEDICIPAGCISMLYGLSLWNWVVFWVVGGLMLIGIGILIWLRKVNHAA